MIPVAWVPGADPGKLGDPREAIPLPFLRDPRPGQDEKGARLQRHRSLHRRRSDPRTEGHRQVHGRPGHRRASAPAVRRARVPIRLSPRPERGPLPGVSGQGGEKGGPRPRRELRAGGGASAQCLGGSGRGIHRHRGGAEDGQRVFQPGILARAHRAILYVDEVNLLDDHIVDLLLDVAVTGVNLVEREGVSYAHPCRFILAGTMNPVEGELRPQLLDRFGLCVEIQTERATAHRKEIARRALAFQADPEGFGLKWQAPQELLQAEIARARELLPTLSPSEDLVSLAAEVAEDTKVDGHRAEITMLKASLAAAALRGQREPAPEDLRDIIELSLCHRIKRLPFQETALDTKTLDRLAGAFLARRHL